jgi:hypothetical protein
VESEIAPGQRRDLGQPPVWSAIASSARSRRPSSAERSIAWSLCLTAAGVSATALPLAYTRWRWTRAIGFSPRSSP